MPPLPGAERARRQRGLRWLALVVVGGLLDGLVIVGVNWLHVRAESVPPPIGARLMGTCGVCPEGMVLVPGGTFTMGDEEELGMVDDYFNRPPHRVAISSFCMDRTEVTVAAYRAFVTATHRSEEGLTRFSSCNWGRSEPDIGWHPINCVNWTDARNYCAWRGGSLPTEAQWEFAARGTEGRRYPWGPTEPAGQLCWSGVSGRRGTCPVHSFPAGDTPLGLADMAGNIWEWTSGGIRGYKPNSGSSVLRDPPDPVDGSVRGLRGGAWNNNVARYVRAVFRDGSDVTFRYDRVGFRCARGIP